MTRLIFLPDDGSPIVMYESQLNLVDLARRLELKGELFTQRQGNWWVAGDPLAAGAQLSPRQTEVLAGLAQGLTSRQMAQRLKLTERMVAFHVAALKVRLKACSRAEIVAHAKDLKLI